MRVRIASTLLAVSLATVVTVASMPAAQAAAATATATVLRLELPGPVPEGQDVRVRATLMDPAAVAVEGATVVLLQGRPDDAVVDAVVATGTTDAAGTVRLIAPPDRRRPFVSYYARFEGDADRAASVSTTGRVRMAGVTAATTTSLAAPSRATLGRPITVRASVSGIEQGDPRGVVRLERLTSSGWLALRDATIDGRGVASIGVTMVERSTRLRARYLGTDGYTASSSADVTVSAAPQTTTLTLTAPRKIVDERTLRVSARLRTPHGAVAGSRVEFQARRGGTWRTYRTARTNGAGVARATSTPRRTYRYRAVFRSASYYAASTSTSRRVENLPPAKVVRLPRKAPRPVRLPAQARATGAGARATISPVGSSVWRSMTGRSWRAGCPVGRDQLRVVRVNYWGFDGYRHRGELVVHRAIAGRTARAFTDLYRHRVPIRAMYRVDRFGYSARVRGADDYRSMAADNTSAFNCRNVVGRPGVRSPHAYGRAIDLNPFENPFRSGTDGWVPNSWWRTRSAGTYAWTKASHLVPRIMRRHGFRWTYGTADGHHFDG